MSGLDDEDLLYHLAYECESLFDQLRDSSTKLSLELCLEFQQRFAMWAANLGVFARKSQSLDTRLRNSHDLQDLAVRLLDILRRSLQQCAAETRSQESGGLNAIGLDKSQTGIHEAQSEALKAIDDSLTRLNRLGVTIRRSGYGRIDMGVQQFAAASKRHSLSLTEDTNETTQVNEPHSRGLASTILSI
ncbi:hypothetical protein GGR51DRAFT_515159 [Nemania sp. FL0031]|nr:hypothetical protein GGR51DRAFT_515159 [Nemania sp. FL0031]